jgi:NAD(P)-dependent dehydrogenase (short-subunit alcohol dehydrogenase family)
MCDNNRRGLRINYCFAKLLLEKNCNVVIADLALRPEAQKLIDDYTTQPRAVFVKTNVVMWNELNNMFDVAEKEFGGADIVRRPHNRPPPTTEIP